MFKELLKEKLGINITEEQEKQFELYYELLIEYNKHTNLTTITNKDDVYTKHFLDSIMLYKEINEDNLSICDMGAGAGFPSIPLKIINPSLHITIVDSLRKRITFLESLINKLNLNNVTLVHERAEVFSLANQKKFDYVTARALGHLRFILEMGVPMLKEGGKFVAMKSVNLESEKEESFNAVTKLKLSLSKTITYELPKIEEDRYLLVYKKGVHVNGYPRANNIMRKKPL